MAFIIGLGALTYTLYALSPERAKAEQDKKVIFTLAQAKDAVMSYSVSRTGAGDRPGNMPRPDYFASTETPPDYDGTSETGCIDFAKSTGLPLKSSGANMRCLGRLPWKTIGLDLQDTTQNDPLGKMPWYAVSANLTDPTCLDVINPTLLNASYTGYVCAGTTLPHPWLTVRDSMGNVISNRVAVVLMMPNTVIGVQSRPQSALNGASAYLDTISVPATCVVPCVPGNYNNADFDNDFILTDMNDELLYITIDELMYALEKRVLQQTKDALKQFYDANNFYPFAADLGFYTSPNPNQNQCAKGNLRGLLPVNAPLAHTCSCKANVTGGGECDCNFAVVKDVAFTRDSGEFAISGANIATDACKNTSKKICTCHGAGECKSATGAREFFCNACGQCTATVDGADTNAFTFTTTGKFVNSNDACSHKAKKVVCDNNSAGDFTLDACDGDEQITSQPATGGLLPAWFKDNQWEKYIVYAVSDDCVSTRKNCTATPQISVGANQGVRSIVATSLANPNGSCNIASYLSSTENTNSVMSNGSTFQDTIYQLTQPKTQSNSDQLVVTAP